MKINIFNIKLFVFLIIMILLSSNIIATENRIDNFECINTFDYDWKINTKTDFTYSESIETLNDILYLLETSYIDYDEMEIRGFDKEIFISNIDSLYKINKSINIQTLFNYICCNIEPYVNDSHLNIYIENNNKSFSQQKFIYLSGTYVEKFKTCYKVIKSEKISYGTEIKLSEENLFKTILNGNVVYRVGILANAGKYGNFTNLFVEIDNKKVGLQCIYTPEYFTTNEFKVIESKDSVYINIPIFDVGTDHFKQFEVLGKKYKNKKNMIIDLRQNSGGNSFYYLKFLYDLYSNEESETVLNEFINIIDCKTKGIFSPLIMQQMNMQNEYYRNKGININYYEFEKDLNSYGIFYQEKSDVVNINKRDDKFKGNLIFLISKLSASSSESLIISSRNLFDNVITVGTNTMGCITFGNAHLYRLRNSGIVMQVCQKQWFYDYDIQEGVGYMPDYIVTRDILDTIKFITRDKRIIKEIKS